jgi:hypothetical protein
VNLGIDLNWYGAQSVQGLTSANGSVYSRLLELYVSVLDDDGKQLVREDDAVWPKYNHYLGGLCPVVQTANPLTYDANGMEQSYRLSGTLPFLAC